MKAPAGGSLPPPEAAFPRRRQPSPAGGRLPPRGRWQGEAEPGVEGTPIDEGRGTCMQPPPEVAFPYGEGGRAKP